jgi:hypothetical protein
MNDSAAALDDLGGGWRRWYKRAVSVNGLPPGSDVLFMRARPTPGAYIAPRNLQKA